MEILRDIAEKKSYPNLVLTLGVFDGVHLGHRSVIGEVVRRARQIGGTSMVMTFDPHPKEILDPEHAPPLITATPHKLRLLEELGIDLCLLIHFDKKFSILSPEDFIKTIVIERLGVQEIYVGYDWVFGKNQEGTVDLLNKFSSNGRFVVREMPPVVIDDILVSSTAIRKLVMAGELELAGTLLGREFSVLGTVVKGDTIGRHLGYPTANCDPHHEVVPPSGVYVVAIKIDEQVRYGLMNIGIRPTFLSQVKHTRDEVKERIEVHIFDFSKDIYDTVLEISFIQKLREEHPFEDKDVLIQQIADDERTARKLLKEKGLL